MKAGCKNKLRRANMAFRDVIALGQLALSVAFDPQQSEIPRVLQSVSYDKSEECYGYLFSSFRMERTCS